MDFPIDKIIAELKKSAPIGFVVFLCLSIFGLLIFIDVIHGIKQAFPAWATYSLMIGCALATIGCLVIFAGQHATTFINRKKKRRYADKCDQQERAMVFDHVHHLDGLQLIILLGFLRSRNGRGEQITHSKILEQMKNYKVLEDEVTLYSGADGSRTLVVHPALFKDRDKQDRIITEILKTRFNTTFEDNIALKTRIENAQEKQDYQSHYSKKFVRLPTLFNS